MNIAPAIVIHAPGDPKKVWWNGVYLVCPTCGQQVQLGARAPEAANVAVHSRDDNLQPASLIVTCELCYTPIKTTKPQ